MPKHVDSLKGLTDAYLFEKIHNREQREGYKTVASMREFYEVVKAKSDEQKEVYNRRV
jgi:hypothetical protein